MSLSKRSAEYIRASIGVLLTLPLKFIHNEVGLLKKIQGTLQRNGVSFSVISGFGLYKNRDGNYAVSILLGGSAELSFIYKDGAFSVVELAYLDEDEKFSTSSIGLAIEEGLSSKEVGIPLSILLKDTSELFQGVEDLTEKYNYIVFVHEDGLDSLLIYEGSNNFLYPLDTKNDFFKLRNIADTVLNYNTNKNFTSSFESLNVNSFQNKTFIN